MSATIVHSQADRVAELVQPTKPPTSPFSFAFDNFLRREHRFGLDHDRPQCKAFLQGHCPLGNTCPDRHQASAHGFNSLVCKHWMRALCKKGDACEFLHEYNLRRMPECNNFSRHGSCPNGDDCMYQHISASAKRLPCPHYERGLCALGPLCADRHVKKDAICRFYLAGFCPEGRECTYGAHPRWRDELSKQRAARQQDPTGGAATEEGTERAEGVDGGDLSGGRCGGQEGGTGTGTGMVGDGTRGDDKGGRGEQSKLGARQWQHRKGRKGGSRRRQH